MYSLVRVSYEMRKVKRKNVLSFHFTWNKGGFSIITQRERIKSLGEINEGMSRGYRNISYRERRCKNSLEGTTTLSFEIT